MIEFFSSAKELVKSSATNKKLKIWKDLNKETKKIDFQFFEKITQWKNVNFYSALIFIMKHLVSHSFSNFF